jgi:dTMP kinase
MTARGVFITLEGIDGSGKSSQIRLLAEALRARGREVVATREPGGTPLGRQLRSVFLETEEEVEPLAELLLFAADRAQHVKHLIEPALAAGKIVISDRYADSTEVYQGAGRGFPPELVAQVIQLATGGLKPDLTLLFDVEPEIGFARSRNRAESGAGHNRMDKEQALFYEKVRAAYFEIAKRELRYRVIDANRSEAEIHADTLRAVEEFLSKHV